MHYPGTGDFRRNLHSLRSCLPADKRWCKHARHLGQTQFRTIFQWGNGCSKARDFESFLHQENLTQNLLGKQFSELYGFFVFFFLQIFGELHRSFSNFCRFNPKSIGKCILQLPKLPTTQNLDMCRHNISFLMTNPNFHVPATCFFYGLNAPWHVLVIHVLVIHQGISHMKPSTAPQLKS